MPAKPQQFAMMVSLFLGGCLSYQVSERYYEPEGPGRLESSPVKPGPPMQLDIAAPSLRKLTVRATPSSRYAMVCVLITPQQNANVEIGASIIRGAQVSSGENLLRLHDYYQVVFSPNEWNFRETMPRTVTLPTRITGTRRVGDGIGALRDDRWLGLSACSEVATTADQFVVDFESVTINGVPFAIPSVRFHAKTGTFTLQRSPS